MNDNGLFRNLCRWSIESRGYEAVTLSDSSKGGNGYLLF